MSQRTANDLGDAVSPAATASDLLDQLHSLINSDRFDPKVEGRWDDLSAQMQRKVLQDEEEIDGLLDRLSDIKRSIKELHHSINHLRTRRDTLKHQLSEISHDSESESGGGLSNDELLTSSLTQLTETVAQFERLFGIKLQRTANDTLKITFRGCSGPSAPDILCTCKLRYNRCGRLDIVGCNPPIPDIDRLVNHLNLTFDMRSFLIVLRRRFCRYFELAAAVSNKVD